ncbi:hypothetical protein AKJ09_00382 [Labilithrix luteola]|uniref:Uncharacterized protein n=1 Tax=Labilithrix luteola TaxID=1391654 RepID=A0A0K1PJK8_9BACT|nr:hypothetical protein [Labilithrix luteola]AKU93718.1 hypothetical protein AKJ09_00382 [Labilithrix luteola]
MRIDTRRAALRAAGKVALVSSALACGATSGVEVPEAAATDVTKAPDARDTPVNEEPSATTKDAAPRDSASRDAKTSTDSSTKTCEQGEEGFACCQNQLHAEHPDATPLHETDARTVACCAVLSAHYDALVADGGSEGWGWEKDVSLKRMCCAALDFQGATCTPWGPPMPPAMRRLTERLVA